MLSRSDFSMMGRGACIIQRRIGKLLQKKHEGREEGREGRRGALNADAVPAARPP